MLYRHVLNEVDTECQFRAGPAADAGPLTIADGIEPHFSEAMKLLALGKPAEARRRLVLVASLAALSIAAIDAETTDDPAPAGKAVESWRTGA